MHRERKTYVGVSNVAKFTSFICDSYDSPTDITKTSRLSDDVISLTIKKKIGNVNQVDD